MKKKVGIALTAAALGFASPMVLAEETGAGCGLGKVVMEGKSGTGANIGAAILNVFPIPNTFFMTTAQFAGDAIMGCDPTQTVMNDEEKKAFVATNLDSLSRDIAQGQGAHLTALASMMGIEEADKPLFYAATQEQYSKLFGETTTSAGDILASLHDVMAESPSLHKYTR